jgi:hypothetical protein
MYSEQYLMWTCTLGVAFGCSFSSVTGGAVNSIFQVLQPIGIDGVVLYTRYIYSDSGGSQ